MTILDLIKNSIELISHLLESTLIIDWIRKNIKFANIVILTILILAFFNFAYFANIFNVNQNYPEDGKFGLKKITNAQMDSVCHNKDYYEKQLSEQYEVNFKIYYVNSVHRKLSNKQNTFPAYRWVCEYELKRINSTDNDTNVTNNDTRIIVQERRQSIGLDLEKVICRRNGKKDRAIFLNYKDPNSWYCIK